MIESIQIKNFKCFADSEVKLNHLTILAGANGVGKSTVIQSLLLIRQTIDAFEHHFSSKLEKWMDNIATQPTVGSGNEVDNWAINSKILLNDSYLLQLGNSKEIINSATNSQQIEFILKTKNQSATFGFDASVSSLSLLSNQVSSSILV